MPSSDDFRGMAWWNGLTRSERSFWLALAGSARPVDAWHRFKQEYAPDFSTGSSDAPSDRP